MVGSPGPGARRPATGIAAGSHGPQVSLAGRWALGWSGVHHLVWTIPFHAHPDTRSHRGTVDRPGSLFLSARLAGTAALDHVVLGPGRHRSPQRFDQRADRARLSLRDYFRFL